MDVRGPLSLSGRLALARPGAILMRSRAFRLSGYAFVVLSLMALGAGAVEEGQSHHPDLCTLYPEKTYDDGSLAWTLSDRYAGHGATYQGVSARFGTDGPGTTVVLPMDTHPDTPAIVPSQDGQHLWRLDLRISAQWEPEIPYAPPPADIILESRLRLLVDGVSIASAEDALTVEPGLLGSTNPWQVTTPVETPEGTLRFEFMVGPHQDAPITLDRIRTEITFELAENGWLYDAPGRVNFVVFLSRPDPAAGTPGSLFQIPGNCDDPEDGESASGLDGHQHYDAPAGCASSYPTCGRPGDEICWVVEGYCDAESSIPEPAAPEGGVEAATAIPVSPIEMRLPSPATTGFSAAGFLLLLPPVRRWLAWKSFSLTGGWLLLPLFTRLERNSTLDNPKRQLILSYVERSPGVRFHELKKELGLSHGVLFHHLRVLRHQGLLVWDREGRRLRFRAPRHRLGDQLDPDAVSLLDLVTRRPGINLQEAADELAWTRRKASYWADRLDREGRLVRQRSGNQRRLQVVAPERGIELLPFPPVPSTPARQVETAALSRAGA